MQNDPNPYAATVSGQVAPAPEVARRQLLPIAICLLVTSILHIFLGLFYFAFVHSSLLNGDPQIRQFCMYQGITMLYCLLLISGAFSMMRRGSYLWAVTVCVLSLVPVLGPCYFLAVPFGIWGLLILRRPEVRDSFARM